MQSLMSTKPLRLISTVNKSTQLLQVRAGGILFTPRRHTCHNALIFTELPYKSTNASCGRDSVLISCAPTTRCLGLPLPSLWKPIGKISPNSRRMLRNDLQMRAPAKRDIQMADCPIQRIAGLRPLVAKLSNPLELFLSATAICQFRCVYPAASGRRTHPCRHQDQYSNSFQDLRNPPPFRRTAAWRKSPQLRVWRKTDQV